MQKRLFKILTLTELLVNEIDEPSLTAHPKTKEFLEALQKVQELGEPIIDNFYTNKQVSKSTFFNVMSEKIDFIFKKEFNKIS